MSDNLLRIGIFGRIVIDYQLNSIKTLTFHHTLYSKVIQYPNTQWDSNQLKCKGELTRVNDIDINHGIEYKDMNGLSKNQL